MNLIKVSRRVTSANGRDDTTNLDGYHAGFFVGVSIAAFCPRHTQ